MRVKSIIFLCTAIPVIVADQWTKLLILRNYRLGETLVLIDGFFNFTYVQNRGAAFSFLNNAPASFRDPFFLIVPFVILSVLAYFYYKLLPTQKLAALSMSLIASGAIGNLIDRIRLGYVVDFLHFHWKDVYHYPMFNIADSCIVVGVGYLFIESIFKKPEAKAAT